MVFVFFGLNVSFCDRFFFAVGGFDLSDFTGFLCLLTWTINDNCLYCIRPSPSLFLKILRMNFLGGFFLRWLMVEV
jgi:hypothetical protein